MALNYKIFLKKTNQLLLDIFVFISAFFISYFIRFEGIPEEAYLKQMLIIFFYLAIARIISFHIFSIYSLVWKYVSIKDVLLITKAVVLVSVILFLMRIFMPENLNLLKIPISIIVLEFSIVLLGTLGLRMTRRLMHELYERNVYIEQNNNQTKKIILIGAGDTGNMMITELKNRPNLGVEVVGFVDDNPKKIKNVIHGTRVLCDTHQIINIAKKFNIDEAIITIANASSKDIRRIVDICNRAEIKVKIVPSLFELLDEKMNLSKIREININDLLGRDVVKFDAHLAGIAKHYSNKRILITGAGGSIGSELCRQLLNLWPEELILIDKDENSVFEINNDLNHKANSINWIPLIADIRNLRGLESIFKKYRPEIIFHAAAHKHVPLMEDNIQEAILNNVLATKNIIQLANKYFVENFIFISTDKAVNPVSVMGASKKIGELLVQEIASKGHPKYSCVRFGNVLGSRGSVIPLFQKQIEQGGPVTITHPGAERYFMSSSEAVQLIIQIGTIGKNGEIFVLDMGEPVNILDLAKELIKLSGNKIEDFEIKYIGLRPGERLREEVFIDEERMEITQFEKIQMLHPVRVDSNNFSRNLNSLLRAANSSNEIKVIECLKKMEIGFQGGRYRAGNKMSRSF